VQDLREVKTYRWEFVPRLAPGDNQMKLSQAVQEFVAEQIIPEGHPFQVEGSLMRNVIPGR
jgi:hypothetical protein